MAQSSSNVHVPIAARITQQIDESSLVTLRGNTHPLAKPLYDHGLAPASLPARRMLLVLKRSPQQEADLTAFLADVQTTSSPNYHKFITPEEFGALYGPADADIQTVSTWLQGHGFAVNKVNKAKTVVEFSGNAAQLQEAFHTEIHSYMVKGEQHYANASDPQIPAALAPLVAGVAQMNTFHMKSHLKAGPVAAFDPATKIIKPLLTGSGTPPTLYVGPSDAATIYNSPNPALNKNFVGGTTCPGGSTCDGTGVNIGVAGLGNIDPNDVANYRSLFGLSANAPTIVVDGDAPILTDLSDGDASEALLDVEISGGIAPGAKVFLYTAFADPFALQDPLYFGINRALDDNTVSILNVSFGACEAGLGNTQNQQNYNAWEEAAAQGISVTVSTGDDGSAGCDDQNSETTAQGGLAVNGLASTPFNIAVGGTDFDVLLNSFSNFVLPTNTLPYRGTATKYIPENPWNNSTDANTTISSNVAYHDPNNNNQTNIVAASGGASSCAQVTGNLCQGYAKPSWQKLFDNGDHVRDLPDVSMFASNGFYGAAWALCGHLTQSGTLITECSPDSTGRYYISGVGGTSTAAPAFAGVLALVSQKVGGRLGQANQVIYPLAKKTPSVFHDVTTGNISVVCTSGSPNCGSNGFLNGYNAASGYDLATGLGSVDISALVNNWSSITFAASTTALTLNGSTAPLAIVHGTKVDVGVQVSGSGTPTGDISIVDSLNAATNPNNVAIAGPATLDSSAKTSFSITYLPGGTYNVTAHYGGDGVNAQSDSNAIPVVVTPENSQLNVQTTIEDPSSGAQGVAATLPYGFIAIVDVAPVSTTSTNDGFATGSVTFSGGINQTKSLNSSGYVQLETASLTPGSSTTISYSGDSSFNQSSAALPLTITKGATATAATLSASSVASSGTVTISAAISTDSVGNSPTGTVTFTSGATSLGSGTVTGSFSSTTGLDNGTASISINGSALPVGANNITATYSGDSNYAGSVSPVVTLTITGGGGGGGGSSFGLSGNAITFTHGATSGNTSAISVTPAGGYTGTVNLSCAITSSPVGAQDLPGCSITPSVTISGATAGTATLTITSTPTTGALTFPANSPFNHGRHSEWYAAGGAALACVLLFGIPARRRAWRAMMAVVLFAGVASIASGCGGGSSSSTSNPGTTTGAYVVTVTGVDSITATLKATTNINVTIN
ncbi:MAG TPA: protease pro-enzyme activation domain-containing protein [Acidisarcina sp.]